MNNRNLYKVSIVTTAVIFLLAAVVAIAETLGIALAIVAVGLAFSVMSAHLRHRIMVGLAKSHAANQTKAIQTELAKVMDVLRGAQGDTASELRELSAHITAMSSTLEINLHSTVASSESIVLADLLTLRHRIDTALSSRELG